MKKSELVSLIETIVRKQLNEATDHWSLISGEAHMYRPHGERHGPKLHMML